MNQLQHEYEMHAQEQNKNIILRFIWKIAISQGLEDCGPDFILG